MLHDLVYQIIEEVCWDRDYLFRCFTGAFTDLTNAIYNRGASEPQGSIVVAGIKSNIEAVITWKLQHQLDYFGPNALTLDYTIRNTSSGVTVRSGSAAFDLATGSAVP